MDLMADIGATHTRCALLDDQGKEVEPLDLVRRKGMIKAKTNPQSGDNLHEKTFSPKRHTAPDQRQCTCGRKAHHVRVARLRTPAVRKIANSRDRQFP